jgi:hypothetical protein
MGCTDTSFVERHTRNTAARHGDASTAGVSSSSRFNLKPDPYRDTLNPLHVCTDHVFISGTVTTRPVNYNSRKRADLLYSAYAWSRSHTAAFWVGHHRIHVAQDTFLLWKPQRTFALHKRWAFPDSMDNNYLPQNNSATLNLFSFESCNTVLMWLEISMRRGNKLPPSSEHTHNICSNMNAHTGILAQVSMQSSRWLSTFQKPLETAG